MCTNQRLMNSLECYMDDLVDCFEDFVKKSLLLITVAIGALLLMLGYLIKVVIDRPELRAQSQVQAQDQVDGQAQARTWGAAQTPGQTKASTLNQPMTKVLPWCRAREQPSTQPPAELVNFQRELNSPLKPGALKYVENSAENALSHDTIDNDREGSSRKPRSTQQDNVTRAVHDCSKRTACAGANTGPLSSMPSMDEKVLRNIGLTSCSKSCMQSRRSILHNSSSRVFIPSLPTCIPNHHLSPSRQCSRFIASRNSCCSMCCADDDRR